MGLTQPRRRPAAPPPADARRAAFDVLVAVLDRRQLLDDALEQTASLDNLAGRDRAFARLLVGTVLRRLAALDQIIDPLLAHPFKPKDLGARHLLRLGAAQLLVLNTPAHAAVGSMVDLAAPVGLPHLKGVLNAVLRRVATEGPALFAALDHDRLTLPDWLWQSWTASYGEAATRAIAAAIRQDPPLDITLRPGLDPVAWAETLSADLLPTGSLRSRAEGAIPSLPGFADGQWWVQDAAAALPVRLLGDVAGRTVADLCAAPGGKTLQLAALGAKVVAVDRSAKRLERVTHNLARLGLADQVSLVAADVGKWQPDQLFDAILLDAPCSATGTARRHPDLLHLKTQGDAATLAGVQDRLIDAALPMLAPGGVLVFCTCSLQPDEGPDRIAAALARHGDLRRLPVQAEEIGGAALAECLTPEGDLRTLPHQLGGVDGFYAARLTR